MKIARILSDSGPTYALIEEDGFRPIFGNPFGEWSRTDRLIPTSEATLLAPVQPPQIIAIGLNYRAHAAEGGFGVPDAPVIFVKTINALAGPEDPILLPKIAPNEVDYEAELVIVMGKTAKHVSVEDAPKYVLGYTCGNDVSARDCQLRLDKQWARGKSFDTFAPIGPWITTEIDPDKLHIGLTLNGQVMQDSSTSDLIFSTAKLVSFVSQNLTLYPGSIIMTGTPSGVGMGRKPPVYLKAGDEVVVEIEGLGKLRNPVVAE
jgi:2-keto-4-pentenoate hydratase/2-oxohepta-3-ene-1,7-dioic acid hydratase in catechol pathway